MRSPQYLAVVVICVACITVLAFQALLGSASRAQDEPVSAVWLELVNQVRLDEGLDPYSRSRLLTTAAQRHADDLAENGLADPNDPHRGSDRTDEEDRIDEAGYAAWTINGDEMVVGEDVWSGLGTPQEALDYFLGNQDDRDRLLSEGYREVGIGVATGPDAATTYVLDFGARPNALPIFINDGALSTENREVAIRLTNERVRPEGKGAALMGEAIEIRMSNEPSFERLTWQSWAPLVSWMLPDVAGDHTVYVQFRDAAGRTAASADSIFLDKGTPTTATAVPLSSTLTAQSTGPGPSSPPPETSPSGEGGTDVPSLAAASPEPSISPSGSGPAPSYASPFPTWTPLPSPEPTPVDLDADVEAVLSLPSMEDYRGTLVAVGILQGLVILLGIYWMARTGKGV
jgi:uncharacterized protein YkwD